MTSATNERAIRARDDRLKKDRAVNKTVIGALMSTIDGRRWIWLRLEEARIFVADEDLDPARMAFGKGTRNAGLRLLADVTTFCPREYVRMTEENTGVNLTEETTDGGDADTNPDE